MPLNANAARSTFACRLRLLWRHNCMPRPQSAPDREREGVRGKEGAQGMAIIFKHFCVPHKLAL